jgi:hypothetical protein
MSELKRKGIGAPPIKKRFANALRGTGNAYTAAMMTVSAAVRDSLAVAKRRGTSPIGALTHVALGAIRGTLEVETDLSSAAKGILVGILHGSGDRGEAAFRTISHTARTIVHHTAITGSDVTSVVAGLVEGAIQCGQDHEVDVTRAASAAAQGALEGAEEAGFAAVEQVRKALKGRFQGTKLPLLAPFQPHERR